MNPVMQYSKSGIALTESFEGVRLTAYQDSGGVWTIGYGHTQGVKEGDTCTPLLAETYLLLDVHTAVNTVNEAVVGPLTQPEFDALVDFVFNCGAGNFLSSTLLKLLNAGNLAGAAAEFEKWDHAGGQVVAGLLRRRLAEEAEFKS